MSLQSGQFNHPCDRRLLGYRKLCSKSNIVLVSLLVVDICLVIRIECYITYIVSWSTTFVFNQVPKGRSALLTAHKVREIFFTGYREAEFICVCDIRKTSTIVVQVRNRGIVL